VQVQIRANFLHLLAAQGCARSGIPILSQGLRTRSAGLVGFVFFFFFLNSPGCEPPSLSHRGSRIVCTSSSPVGFIAAGRSGGEDTYLSPVEGGPSCQLFGCGPVLTHICTVLTHICTKLGFDVTSAFVGSTCSTPRTAPFWGSSSFILRHSSINGRVTDSAAKRGVGHGETYPLTTLFL
jgi:hypothetical protein